MAGYLELPNWYNHQKVVYDPEGLSPTLCAGMGEGGNKVKIILREKSKNG